MHSSDVVIIGGGISGLITAVALRSHAFKVVLLPGSAVPDGRKQSIAVVLNAHSVALLHTMGLDVRAHAVTPVYSCNVSAKKHYGRIEFAAQDIGLGDLGCVIMADALERLCQSVLDDDPAVQIMPGAQMTTYNRTDDGFMDVQYLQKNTTYTLRARLLLACDGVASHCRQQAGFMVDSATLDYRCMIVPVLLKSPHNGMSMQRFLAPGTCAFIPTTAYAGRVIWTLPSAKVQARMHVSESQLLRMVQHDCIAKLGRVEAITGKPVVYAVAMQRSRSLSKEGMVLIGNTASHFLPITAGGLNLTIRDIAVLHAMLAAQNTIEWGREQVVQYQQQRLSDHVRVYESVHWLLRIFRSSHPILNSVRSAGMVLGRMPIVYKHLLRFALGESNIPLLQRAIRK